MLLLDEKKAEDLTNPDVVTKYRKAAEIANDALKAVIKVNHSCKKTARLTLKYLCCI